MVRIDFESINAAAGTVGKTSELLSLATVKPEATDWLWHHRIPRGAQTISTGWPGVGKSQQQCDIVARASTGTRWPDGSPCPCGDTIMLTCEDSYAKTVIPRLRAAGANLERVYALPIIRTDARKFWGFDTQEEWDAAMKQMAKESEGEFYVSVIRYVRGQPNDISPGTVGACKADIAKKLSEEDPTLLETENKDRLIRTIESIYDRDHAVTITLTQEDIAFAKMLATHEDDLPSA